MNIVGTIVLKPGREASVLRFHPWIFSGGIAKKEDGLSEGCWVKVCDSKGNTLGFGHYQNGSIMVRLVQFGDTLDADIFSTRIRDAFDTRMAAGVIRQGTNCYRLVHGEGDGLPGLVIDFYDKVVVVQAHSEGMNNDKQLIAEAIQSVLGPLVEAIYFKNTTNPQGEYLWGMAPVPHTVLEYGQKFLVDWESGQKTGFFLDQRENRALLARYVYGKTVLNTFCYSGGFSVYALQGQAALVHSVDSSAGAIELCKKNLALNGFDANQHACIASDTFDFFKKSETKYDVIILDPPAFAKHKDSKHQAMKGYQRLNAEAIRLINPGGIIFTFSCSGVVDRKLFYDTVMSSAIQAGRQVKVLSHLSQPADHPVSAFHPEGEYLKGLVLHVK
jgi:23S rRNA (cytosine1962-C5)-methyltransferase